MKNMLKLWMMWNRASNKRSMSSSRCWEKLTGPEMDLKGIAELKKLLGGK